jgi:hypothetical protein
LHVQPFEDEWDAEENGDGGAKRNYPRCIRLLMREGNASVDVKSQHADTTGKV